MKKYISIFIILSFSLFSNEIAFSIKKNVFEKNSLTIKGINITYNNKINFVKRPNIYCFGLDIPNKEKLNDILTPYIGKDLSIENINKIEDEVKKYFLDENVLFTTVYAPTNQKITDGIIIINVERAKAGKVVSQGAKYFSNKGILKRLDINTGEEIDLKEIQRKLTILNNSPFRNTEIFYSEGEKFNETDILISTQDILPLRVYGGYDFTGYNVAGESRYFVGTNIGSLYFLDGEIDYQYLFNPKIKKWQGHTGSIDLPMFLSTNLKIYGNYIKTKPDIGLEAVGKSWMVAGKYYVPFVTTYVQFSLLVGFEFKRTNNFLNFVTNDEKFEDIDIAQFQIAFEGVEKDSRGKTAFQAYLYYSPGRLTTYNKTRYFKNQRPGSKCDYVYAFATLDRETNIYKDFRWMLALKGQLSSAKLMPSEEFSLGGAHTIRGYDENTIIGDNGCYIKNEFRTPRVGFIKNKKDAFELLAFLDYGNLWDADPTIENRITTHLFSCGLGVRYHIEEILTFRCDYGFPIEKAIQNKKREGRFHIGVVLSY